MTTKITISIVTAALNAAETIRTCVESVKKQDYPLEHVVVDGLSVDGTPEMAKKYGPPNAIIISEADRGPYDAINKGLALVTGEVVGTLNADDFYPHNHVLSIVSKAFENPEVDACYGDLVYVDRGNPARIVRYWKSKPFNKRLFYNGWMPAHPTFFVRRSLYKNLGTFNLDQGSAADYELMLRFLLRYGVRAYYIPTLLAVMRTGGLSNRSVKQRVRANRLDRQAWTTNGLKPKPWTSLAKPARKIFQFFSKGPHSRPWLDANWPSVREEQHLEKEKLSRTPRSNENQKSTKVHGDIPFYVVTVNYRSEASLARLIDSLQPMHFVKKLIVVNHSDGVIHIPPCRFPVQMISQPNIGYGGGLNRGLRQIRESDAIALLCNPDIIIVGTDGLTNGIHYLNANPEIGCLVPCLVNEQSKPIACWKSFYTIRSLATARIKFLSKLYPDFGQNSCSKHGLADPCKVDWGSGSALLFKTCLYPYPVSFDERFFLYFEDVDFCAQIWKAGLSVEFYPGLTYQHEAAMASRRSAYFLALHICSLVKFMLKYKGFPDRQDLIRQAIPKDL